MKEELSDADILRLNALCDELLDGAMSGERHAELERYLATDEAARCHYVRTMGLSASLHTYAAEFESDEGGETMVSFPKQTKPHLLRSRYSFAAALLLSLFLGALLMQQWPGVRDARLGIAQDDGVAVITRASGIQWTDGAVCYRLGDRVPVGKLQVKTGTMQIEFYSGATIILEGPANLEIRSANEAFCHFGKIRGSVPPQAIGFTISTPEYDLVDLGTEFGISVEPNGISEVHVFDGIVELRGVGRETNQTKGLAEGEAIRLTGAVTGEVFGMNQELFPGSSALDDVDGALAESRFQKWKTFSNDLRKDPGLIAYFTFEPERLWDRVLHNQGQSNEAGLNGAIVGAKWTGGRWPGKQALDFKSPADRVRLILPGEFDALTFAVWVRLDGLDRKWNSLLLTDDWKPGSIHWQFGQSGEMILGTRGGKVYKNYFSEKEIGFDDLGRWMFLATVFDLEKREVRHVIDEKVISRETIDAPEHFLPIKFGAMELGNYRPAGKSGTQDVRNFNGRMDEFMLFNRALSDGELVEIFQVGRPEASLQK